ncbi:MAG: hypothetical protein SF162_06145 [bacterium]|nr:hypothetical protein [bacterium]
MISRHRIPHPLRAALALAWVAPHAVLTVALAAHLRDDPARLAGLLDVRYWVPLALLLIPAVYIWREGIDVRRGGVTTRLHVPRTLAYHELRAWRWDRRTGIVTVWDRHGRTAFETHIAHLTQHERLIAALEQHVERES